MGAETRATANLRQTVPFFWVRDVEASVEFYVDRLAFELKKEWRDGGKLRWCWLERGGVAVMLQEFWTEGRHYNIPESRTGVGFQLCFLCDDAVALWRELVGRGVQASRPFVGNGAWVTQLSDPDGFQLLFESPTDEPEETVLAE